MPAVSARDATDQGRSGRAWMSDRARPTCGSAIPRSQPRSSHSPAARCERTAWMSRRSASPDATTPEPGRPDPTSAPRRATVEASHGSGEAGERRQERVPAPVAEPEHARDQPGGGARARVLAGTRAEPEHERLDPDLGRQGLPPEPGQRARERDEPGPRRRRQLVGLAARQDGDVAGAEPRRPGPAGQPQPRLPREDDVERRAPHGILGEPRPARELHAAEHRALQPEALEHAFERVQAVLRFGTMGQPSGRRSGR